MISLVSTQTAVYKSRQSSTGSTINKCHHIDREAATWFKFSYSGIPLLGQDLVESGVWYFHVKNTMFDRLIDNWFKQWKKTYEHAVQQLSFEGGWVVILLYLNSAHGETADNMCDNI